MSKSKLRSNPSRLANVGERVTRSASWRNDKTSSTARGYGYDWQQARAEHLAANPLCVICQRKGRVRQATHVDHIKPHNGDPVIFWDRTNWQSLCAHCHNAIKQRMERAIYAGAKRVNTRTRVQHASARADVDGSNGLTSGEGGVKVPPTVDT